jgi:hypothetical protein
MNAPWKVGPVEMWWGKDAEGHANGIDWCGLCGTETAEGVVVKMSGQGEKGTAFFCKECILMMYHSATYRTAQFKA